MFVPILFSWERIWEVVSWERGIAVSTGAVSEDLCIDPNEGWEREGEIGLLEWVGEWIWGLNTEDCGWLLFTDWENNGCERMCVGLTNPWMCSEYIYWGSLCYLEKRVECVGSSAADKVLCAGDCEVLFEVGEENRACRAEIGSGEGGGGTETERIVFCWLLVFGWGCAGEWCVIISSGGGTDVDLMW